MDNEMNLRPMLVGPKMVAFLLEVSERRAQQIIASIEHVVLNDPGSKKPHRKVRLEVLEAYLASQTRNRGVVAPENRKRPPEKKRTGRPRKGVQ